jgi:hypothetical protein
VLEPFITKILDRLSSNKKVGLFCMGGHGRTGYIASIVLGRLGYQDPIGFLRANYCKEAVESNEQVQRIADMLGRPELAEKYKSTYGGGNGFMAYRHFGIDHEYFSWLKPHLTEKAVKMADHYSRKLAEYYNNYYRNEASCPSVMISGPANFPVRKKEKQNRRREKLMKDWEYLQSYAGKIEYLLTMEQPICIFRLNGVLFSLMAA